MRIIFFSCDTSDYLNISLLHGLKSLENVEVIDFPKSEISYNINKYELSPFIRGNAFSLFFNLEDKNLNRFHIKYDYIIPGDYDLVIFGDIKSSFGYYFELFPYLKKNSTAILDGSDDSFLFGNEGFFWKKMYYWLIPKPQNFFLYFKRELIHSEIIKAKYFKLLPKFLTYLIPQNKNLRKVAFSFPESKIVSNLPLKIKLFPEHIVDEEICEYIYNNKQSKYVFDNEQDYYQDLKSSKFGITTKRAGWDCLRHYEIAANATVICFRDLDKKPKDCAPHGLLPGFNCISYKNYNDLMTQINNINEEKYSILQTNTLNWIKENTTSNRAKNFLKNYNIKTE